VPQPLRKIVLRPTAVAFDPLVTAHGAATTYECIDDDTPNGDTDYITTTSEATGVWQLETATSKGLDTSRPIASVILHSAVKAPPASNATDATTVLFITGGFNEYPGASRTLIAGSGWQDFADEFAINPDTGVPWVVADFDSIFVGHVTTYTDPVPPRVTALWLEVWVALHGRSRYHGRYREGPAVY